MYIGVMLLVIGIVAVGFMLGKEGFRKITQAYGMFLASIPLIVFIMVLALVCKVLF